MSLTRHADAIVALLAQFERARRRPRVRVSARPGAGIPVKRNTAGQWIDRYGQWADLPDLPGEDAFRIASRLAARRASVERAMAGVMPGLQTSRTHRDNNGVWTPERLALHQQIVDDVYARYAGVPSEGRAILTGGLAGAGKTTVLTGAAGVDLNDFVRVGSDEMKDEMARRGLVPDVPGHPDLSPMERAPLIQFESALLAGMLARRAMQDRKNVVFDMTMSSEAVVTPWIEEFRRAGYSDIEGIFVDVPVEVSLERAATRYRIDQAAFETGRGFGGRLVPDAYIRGQALPGGGTVNREVFERIKAMFDGWQVFDNSGAVPNLVDEG